MVANASTLEIIYFISVLLSIVGVSLLILTRGNKSAYALILFGVLMFCNTYLIERSGVLKKDKSISANEEQAIKMFKQNCKQVNFAHGNSDTGIGASSSIVEDSYTYQCDDNIEYTLTYNIEEYRK